MMARYPGFNMESLNFKALKRRNLENGVFFLNDVHGVQCLRAT